MQLNLSDAYEVVVGDDWDAEIAKLTRVCRSGGWVLDCTGDDTPSRGGRVGKEKHDELITRGWEQMSYVGNGGGTVNRYRKQVLKG